MNYKIDLNDIEIRKLLIKAGWFPPKTICKVCGNDIEKTSSNYLDQNGFPCYSVRCGNCGAYYILQED